MSPTSNPSAEVTPGLGGINTRAICISRNECIGVQRSHRQTNQASALQISDHNVSVMDAFKQADQVLLQGVSGSPT